MYSNILIKKTLSIVYFDPLICFAGVFVYIFVMSVFASNS